MSLQVIEGDNDRPKKPWAFPNAFSLEPWLLRCLASSPLFRSSSIQSAGHDLCAVSLLQY